jgi:hypothetical protein
MSKYLSVGGHLEYKGSWKKTTLSRYMTTLSCHITFYILKIVLTN